jgi:cytoplasmic iron level regulating protein YaaA (DUF328/UPF0246 family)
LGRFLGLLPGPDLGIEGQPSAPYLPAYERYDGGLYRAAQLTRDDALGLSVGQVLILSALYGLVTALEPIRYYNLQMEDKLPDGGKVHEFWRNRQLRELVQEAIEHLGATTVWDLLSSKYRKALSPWPPQTLRAVYRTNDDKYRPLKSGSNHHRGKDLRGLLDGND